MLLVQVWTHCWLNWFFLSNPIFAIFLNFQQQNTLKNQYISPLSSENCEVKPYWIWLIEDFPTTPRTPQIPMQFSVSILFSFHWENGSIISSFLIDAPLLIEGFPKYQECNMKCSDLGDLNLTKQNKLPCFVKIPRAWHEVPWFGRSQMIKQNKLPCFIKIPRALQEVLWFGRS